MGKNNNLELTLEFENELHDFLKCLNKKYKDRLDCKVKYDLILQHLFVNFLEEKHFNWFQKVSEFSYAPEKKDGVKYINTIKEFENIFKKCVYDLLKNNLEAIIEESNRKNKKNI